MSTIRETGPPPVEKWPPRACEGVDTVLFFPGVDGGGRSRTQEEAAKKVCRRCPAIRHCAAYAVPIVDLGGVWAGMNVGERSRARNKQKEA